MCLITSNIVQGIVTTLQAVTRAGAARPIPRFKGSAHGAKH